MNQTRNITRYEKGMGSSYSFKGWRLCISRQKERFVRYFSDREHGGDAQVALEAALKMREDIMAELAAGDVAPAELFRRYRKEY